MTDETKRTSDEEWGRKASYWPGGPGAYDTNPAPAGPLPAESSPTVPPEPAPVAGSSAPPGRPAPSPALRPTAAPAPAYHPPKPDAAPPRRRRRIGCGGVLWAALVVAALAFLLAGTALAGYGVVARLLPSPDELQARASQFSSTLIYDREGNLLNEQGDPNYGRRRAVPLEQISQYLIDATLATEDPHFYQHPGVDPVGIARALYYAIKDRDFSSGPGGSTITQQLVKLTYLSPERTISRKMKEAILAAEITRRYPKDTVLAMYLNELNYGNLAYGIEAAAETYFGKRATDLTLAEAAMLAGLPQAPAYYDPYTRLWEADGKPGPVKERQGDVLRLMVENDYITQQQSDAAWQEELELQPLKQVYSLKHPHFVQFARTEVESVLGPELAAKGGLRIYTTLDPRVQAIAEEEVAAQVKKLAGQGAANGATVAMRPTTGELLAMVGSADFNSEAISGQINMAVAPRQPGSALKPFTYLAAFEMPAAVKDANPPTAGPNPTPGGPDPITAIEPPGYWTPSTALMDVVTQFPDGANPPYVPTNYDDREHGLVTVRTALANSLNIPAVKALEHAGLERFKNVARRVGITTLTGDDYGLALTLGGGDVNLLELTGAYAVLANGGVRVPSSTIACVVDAAGKPLWVGAGAPQVQACQQAAAKGGQPAVRPAAARPAVDPQHAYLITSILADREARRPMFGAVADLLGLPDRSAAAKTGTSNDYRDAWTIGYTPDLAVGAWVGNADYTPMKKIAGSVGAAPIWHNVMRRSLDGQPGAAFTQPPGIQRIQVCADTGTLPSPACSRTSEEVFAAGQGPLPAGYDLHQRVRVDRVTGLPATEFTPPDRVEERDVMAFPPKYQEWAAAHGYPVLNVPPPQYAFPPDLDLREPPNDMTVSGLTPVLGRARVPAPLVWRLEYGVGPNPIGWGVLTDFRTDEIDGVIGEWDSEQTAAQHDTGDFSLRLAAYDPANMDYPVAVSAASYTHVAPPRPEPEATFTSEPTPSPTETPPIATPAPSSTPTPLPSASPTLGAPTPTPALTPTPGVTPNPEITPTVTAPVASPLVAALLSPVDGAEVTGQVQISGIAEGPGFTGYELEFAPEGPTGEPVWTPVGNPGLQPVSGGPLAVWDTTALEPGTYRLRLRAYDALGAMATSDVRVQVVRGN